MKAHRNSRALTHAERSLLTILFAAIFLALTFPSDTNAQDVAPQVVAAQYFDAVHGNTSPVLASPNAVLHTPEGEFTGATGISQFGETLEESFSYLDFETQSVETVDNLMVIAFTLTGINTGSYHSVTANCAAIEVSGVAYMQLGETGVVEQWIDYDRDIVTNQISAVNQLDPSEGPGCANPVPAPSDPTPVFPPTCLSANLCETPW